MEKRQAVVEGRVVVNIIVGEHPKGIPLPANSSVAIGWAYDGVIFFPPTIALSLSEIEVAKRGEINAAYVLATAFLRPYPQSEQISWSTQEAEARSFAANFAAATPTLSAIAARTGETVAVLAGKVIANADAFKAGGGDAIGRRRARMKAIDASVAANDTAALQAVVW